MKKKKKKKKIPIDLDALEESNPPSNVDEKSEKTTEGDNQIKDATDEKEEKGILI